VVIRGSAEEIAEFIEVLRRLDQPPAKDRIHPKKSQTTQVDLTSLRQEYESSEQAARQAAADLKRRFEDARRADGKPKKALEELVRKSFELRQKNTPHRPRVGGRHDWMLQRCQ
jgi:hypothetical protein